MGLISLSFSYNIRIQDMCVTDFLIVLQGQETKWGKPLIISLDLLVSTFGLVTVTKVGLVIRYLHVFTALYVI